MPVKIIALLEPALLFMGLSPAGSDCRLRPPNHSLGPLHHTARSRQLPGHPSSHGQSGGDGSRRGEPRGEAAPGTYQSLIWFNSILPLNVGPIFSYEDITILVRCVQQEGKGSSLSSRCFPSRNIKLACHQRPPWWMKTLSEACGFLLKRRGQDEVFKAC